MPSYRSAKHGFEIDLPTGWAITRGLARLPIFLSNVINRANILQEFSRGTRERLNIVVEPLLPEPPPEVNELMFRLNARDMNYTDLEFGRIAVAGRLHAWVRYVMLSKAWSKKYLIVLDGRGFAITASCASPEQLHECEREWDTIAASLRLLRPMSESIAAFNNTPSARRMLEKMRESLEQELEQRGREPGAGPTIR